eukprot:EG_transcript_1496
MPPCLGRSTHTVAALPPRGENTSPIFKWLRNPHKAALCGGPLEDIPALSLAGGEGMPAGVFDGDTEQRLADLGRSGVPFAVSHVDAASQTVLYASDALLELTEYCREDLGHLTCEALFCAEAGAQATLDGWHRAVLAGHHVEEAVAPHTKLGRRYHAVLTLTPVKALHCPVVSHCIWALTEVGAADSNDLSLSEISQTSEMESPKNRTRRDHIALNRNASPLFNARPLVHIPTPPCRRLSRTPLTNSPPGSDLGSRPGSPSSRHEAVVLHVAEDGTILASSSACRATFGFSAAELVGKPLETLLQATEDANAWQWGPHPRLVQATHRTRGDLQLVATAGAVETFCQRECTPVTFQNVTDMPSVQALLRDQRDALAQYKQFVSFIFHEVRQPLSVLHLGLQHIADSCRALHDMTAVDAGELDSYTAASRACSNIVEDIVSTVDDLTVMGQSMNRILSDVLTFEKLTEHKLQMEPGPGRVEDIVLCAQHQTVALFQAKGIRVDVEVDPRLRGVEADFDHCRLQQVLLNFLTNAQKFTPQGGAVRLSLHGVALEEDSVELKVAVEDSGVGIPDSVQRQLFQPFVQHRAGQLQGGGGTGLGLAITKGIIDAHGGSLGVRSAPGHGAEFWFQLRLHRRPANPPTPTNGGRGLMPKPPTSSRKASFSRPEGSTIDVLVVDDQPLNRKYLQKIIARNDYTVSVAASGEEVLQRFSSGERWRLILTDNCMGEMTGAQMIQGLLTLGCDCPIVGITGAGGPADLQRLMAAGAKEVFPKPFRVEDVQHCLARHLLGAHRGF